MTSLVKELGRPLYDLVVSYVGDPTLSTSPAVHQAILKGLLASGHFVHMHIPENLPQEQATERLRELFMEVSDLAEGLKPHVKNLEELDITVYRKIEWIMRNRERDIAFSFVLFFRAIVSESEMAPNSHSLNLHRAWMKSHPKRLETYTELNFSQCQLSIFSREITWLPNLTSLDLRGNAFLSLPPEIGDLQKLRTLVLNGNPLRRLPASLGKLQELETFEMQFCHHIEEFPETLSDLPKLKVLDLRCCDNLPELLGVTLLPPKKPHFYSRKKVEQPPLLPPFLEKLRKQGCDVKF